MVYPMLHAKEKGITMFVIALIMLALMFMLACTLEWGRITRARAEMQQWCDAAALAGAAELPNVNSARQVAVEYYARNLGLEPWQCVLIGEDDGTVNYRVGSDKVSITTPYEDEEVRRSGVTSDRAISVSSERQVPMLLGKMLNVDAVTISAKSVAIYEQSPFRWVLFNNSQDEPLTITGSNVYIEGSLHTNCDLVVRGSRHSASGIASVVGLAQITGSSHSFNVQRSSHRQSPPLPTPLQHYRQQAEELGQLIIGRDYRLSSSNPPSGVVFVEGGDIISHGHGFNANVTLIAVRKYGRGGSIRIVGNSWQLNASDGVLLMFATDEVEVHGSNINFNGVIYAPDAYARITGSGVASTSVIGNGIRVDGSGMNFTPGADIFGERQSRLIE
ncbi:MAG: pilus assembly protein TadG-related protein [Armatimonadetes bacterium]|nr:pilus assembly protein TadG-related protein [Armatimonadota bacterium]